MYYFSLLLEEFSCRFFHPQLNYRLKSASLLLANTLSSCVIFCYPPLSFIIFKLIFSVVSVFSFLTCVECVMCFHMNVFVSLALGTSHLPPLHGVHTVLLSVSLSGDIVCRHDFFLLSVAFVFVFNVTAFLLFSLFLVPGLSFLSCFIWFLFCQKLKFMHTFMISNQQHFLSATMPAGATSSAPLPHDPWHPGQHQTRRWRRNTNNTHKPS